MTALRPFRFGMICEQMQSAEEWIAKARQAEDYGYATFRQPSHHTVQLVLASGPPPSITARRYQTWEKIADPAERRLTVVRLHSEGWSVSSIAEYLDTSRPTVYATLKRWVPEIERRCTCLELTTQLETRWKRKAKQHQSRLGRLPTSH